MKKWFQSAGYALRGIVLGLREERNMRIHFLAMLSALFLGLFLKLSLEELSLIIITCALVICFECINSVLERLLDMIKPRVSLQLEGIKDLMAAAVLIASFSAAIVGILLFVPKMISLFVE